MRRLPAVIFTCLAACRAESPTSLRTPRVMASAPAPPRAFAATPTRAIVRLRPDANREGRAIAELRFEGALAPTSLRFQPTHDVRVEEVVFRDAKGSLDVETASEEQGGRPAWTRFDLSRPPTRWLEVRYAVVLGPATDGYSPLAEPIELRGGGEDLLVLPVAPPAGEEPVPIELHLGTSGSGVEAASSFGLGVHQLVTARLSDLRRAWFLVGDVGTAKFHASDGDDVAAWLGYTAFDPRWVSAEAAGIRSAVDAWVGRSPSPSAPPLSFLITAAPVGAKGTPSIAVASRTRGLVVAADRRAPWTATARVLVAQALVQRYVGGFLWVGDRSDETSGLFFSDGFSRAIAREVLFESGLLDHAERATEMNRLLSAVTFSEDPRQLATARGALLASSLDHALRARSRGARSLRTFIRERLAEAASAKEDTISLADFTAKVRESAGDAAATELETVLQRGTEVSLPKDLLGRCWTLVRRQLVQFELGFVTSAGQDMVVESVKPGSRAEAAGLRVGDVIEQLHYEEGRSSVPVEMRIRRGERAMRLRYVPAGAAKPGRIFERTPGIPDERC